MVEALARAEGFDVVGVTTPDAIPKAAPRLKAAIEAGHHGTMEWLASIAASSTRSSVEAVSITAMRAG